MRLTVSVLGAEVFAVEWEPTKPQRERSGLTEEGAPKVHETNCAGETQLGFQASTPWRHTEVDDP